MRHFAVLIALLLPGLAAAAAPDKQAWKAARPVGKAQSCILTTQIRDTRVRDDRTIDFYMRNRQVYRNTLPNACPQLGFEQRFGYATSINQLCSTDTITVILIGGPQAGPTCGLGQFQPVTGVER